MSKRFMCNSVYVIYMCRVIRVPKWRTDHVYIFLFVQNLLN